MCIILRCINMFFPQESCTCLTTAIINFSTGSCRPAGCCCLRLLSGPRLGVRWGASSWGLAGSRGRGLGGLDCRVSLRLGGRLRSTTAEVPVRSRGDRAVRGAGLAVSGPCGVLRWVPCWILGWGPGAI